MIDLICNIWGCLLRRQQVVYTAAEENTKDTNDRTLTSKKKKVFRIRKHAAIAAQPMIDGRSGDKRSFH